MAELTESLVRSAKPRERQYKMFDSSTPGLHLLIRPTGSKTWRHRETKSGVERVRTLGDWPAMPLSHARAMVSGLRANDTEVSFKAVAEAWLETTNPQRAATSTRVIESRLEMHVYPKLGERPVAAIRAAEVLDIVERLRRARKFETSRRVLAYMSQIFALACVRYDLSFNPAAEVGRVKLAQPNVEHRAAASLDQVGVLLDQLKSYQNQTTARALEFLILTAGRTGEIRFADWSEFSNLDVPGKAAWDIPAARMKMKRSHYVPLSEQAVEVLRRQAGGKWPKAGLVFPISRKAMSENTMLFALYRMGWKGKFTVHGFRATFSTLANEAGKNFDIVEAALAHQESNSVRRAYNHATYEAARRELLNWWAGQVEHVKRKAALL